MNGEFLVHTSAMSDGTSTFCVEHYILNIDRCEIEIGKREVFLSPHFDADKGLAQDSEPSD